MNEVEITRRLAHVEKELATHSQVLAANAESMKGLMERSDERLDYIKERFDEGNRRFDKLEAMITEESDWASKARKSIVGAATTAFCAFATAVWFVIVSPIQEQLAYLDRRLIDAEKRIAVHMHDDTPE